MATINGKPFSTPRNVNLKDGILRFGGTQSTTPFDSTSNGLYINSSNQIVYSSQGSESILGTAGAAVSFSLNDCYDDGRSITVDAGAVTLNGVNMDTATLALNADAGSGGPIVLFTNSGSGNDITGTSATWGITKAGAATFASVVAESITAAADLTLEATGTGTITLAGTSTGAVTVGSTLVVTGGADANAFTITAGDVLISDGKIALTDNDNETILALTSTGVTTGSAIVVTCNGLTDGDMLKLVSSSAGMTTGNFINCYDGASTVFEVGLYGAVTIAGNATGTTSLSLTAGDLTMTDGVVSVTNTADAATVTIVADAQTTGNVIDVNADAVTSGVLLHLDTTAATFSGKYIQCYDGAADEFSVAADGVTTITTSGTGAVGLTITSSNVGALGAVLQLDQTASSAAANDVIGRILFTGQDDAAAAESYGRIDVMITDVAAAGPDADMRFYVDKAGTLTEMLKLDSDLVGIVVGDGSAAATVTSNGAYDLTISTNSTAANEPKIVLTDGATGDITITAGGTSGEIAIASPIKYSGKQEIVNANTAIDVITPLTTIANNAGSTHTLADGVVGQLKTIVCTVYTGDAVITPANFIGTTITLNAAGDAGTGIFLGTEGMTLSLGGTAAVA